MHFFQAQSVNCLQIALLDVLIPVAEYREIRLLYLHLKAEQRRLKIKAQRLQDKNKPAHDLLKYIS